jgi:hypothetical protein
LGDLEGLISIACPIETPAPASENAMASIERE